MKKNRNLLITGGSGFIGSHVADAFSDVGYNVLIFDINKSSYIRPKQKFLSGDILDPASLKKAMKGIDVVFHFAALADIDVAEDRPYETMNINIMGTVNVLEAARKSNIDKVIFASSIYVYSREGSFYKASKHAGELIIEEYSKRYGLKYNILRFGTLYGPRSDDHNSVFRFLKSALDHKKICVKSSGKEVREYIHVADAAQICLKIVENEIDNETLILTGHHRMRVFELLDMINEAMNKTVDIEYNAMGDEAAGSHYEETPYSYIPRMGKKIVTDAYCDLGQSLVEILHEIDTSKASEDIHI